MPLGVGRRFAAVPPLRVADAAVKLRKIILLYKLFILYFASYWDAGCWMLDAECGSAGVQTFASGVRECGRAGCGMQDAGVQTLASGVRDEGCRSADISFWLMAATISPHGFHP